MSAKQLAQIAVALVVLLFLWGLVEILGTGSDTTAARFDLPKLTAADVDTVKIFRATDTLMLVKGRTPGRSTVTSPPARR